MRILNLPFLDMNNIILNLVLYYEAKIRGKNIQVKKQVSFLFLSNKYIM